MNKLKTIAIIGLGLSLGMTSCSDDDEQDPITNNGGNTVSTPDTYEFMRNSMSSVSYSGQTDRLNQLEELKAVLVSGDNGASINAQTLKDMFSNVGDNGNGNFSFSSSKQLKNKTFELDRDNKYFENLFDSTAKASINGSNSTPASNGVAGLLSRSNGASILVDANGREFTQLIEKGLMGATFYHQITNVYLTDSKIGETVDNTNLEQGQNYTEMEHHFDEAFGYVGAPTDFKSNYNGSGNVRFWAKYSNTADDNIQMNDKLMTAYKRARQAIVEKKYDVLDVEVKNIQFRFEQLVAATAIHYANETKIMTNDGDRLHVLSECYAFTRALRYSNPEVRKLTQSEVDTLLGYIGDNYWNTTESNLNLLINKLASTYDLESVKSEL
ncbi:MAG: DUF4856 domain-containing protein [Vicingaceae bacterium]